MSQTPLSDLLERYFATPNEAAAASLVAGFRSSRVGVVVGDGSAGLPADRSMSVGLSFDREGRSFVLVFADPLVFRERFGPRFNGVMAGEDVVEIMHLREDCFGIRINSAKSNISVTIPRAVIEGGFIEPAGGDDSDDDWEG